MEQVARWFSLRSNHELKLGRWVFFVRYCLEKFFKSLSKGKKMRGFKNSEVLVEGKNSFYRDYKAP